MGHPYRDVVVAGVHNTAQARQLEGHDSESITFEAAVGALADAGVQPAEVDAVTKLVADTTHLLREQPK